MNDQLSGNVYKEKYQYWFHWFYRGLVLVDVKLEGLDINQCPTDGTVNNAFKNTAKCHYESQYVSCKLNSEQGHHYCDNVR